MPNEDALRWQMPSRYGPVAQRLLQYARLISVAETPIERRVIMSRLIEDAREHPAFLAPLCFTIDRMDPMGQPLAMWPEWFHVEWLDAALRGDVNSVMLLAARGHAKSEYYSSVLPAWMLGKNPRLRILHVTSSDELAAMYSRRMQEVIQSPEYRAVFPDFPYPDKKFNEHEWYLKVTPHQRDPTWRAKGAGSSITGGRADCLTGDTLITTPRGQVPIRELVGREDLPAVMGFDHGFGAVEPRVVVASRTIEAGETLVELTTAAGRRLRGTRDHRVWSGGAYRPLGTLVAGSPLQTLDGSVDRVRSLVEIPPEPVYDLQVEGTRNFYANGLLVHNCIIVDDIVTLKNSSTAYSRASLLSWYRSTLHPILVPGAGKVIIIGTRYYRDDLYGAFIEGGLEPLIYPAEDEFGRIMWHERFDRPFLEQKKNPPEGSLASYASQYLCQPINPEGEVFRRHWFELVEDTPELTEMWWCWDTAISGATHADFTAGVLAGLGKDGNVYIVDVARGQWEPHVAKEKITTCWLRTKEKWGGLLRGTLVEDTKEGRVLQAWMREAKETRSMPVLMVPHGGRDKMSRAAVIIPFCEAGRVKLLRGWWTDAFIEEIMEFTPSKRHRYDDQVDAFTYAVMRLLRLGGRSGGSYQVITGGGLR